MKEAKREKRNRILNRFSLPLSFALSFAGYFLIEAMSRHSFGKAVRFLDERTQVFFYNALIIFVMTLPAYLIRKRAFWRTAVATLWLTLGAVNGIVLANRVTPLTGPDFRMLDDAMLVAEKYFNTAEIILSVAALLAVAVFLVHWLIVSPVYRGRMRWFLYIPGLAAAILGMWGLTGYLRQTSQISEYFSNIASAYLDYGFPYSLGVTVFDTGISQPDRYSDALVERVLRREGEIPETVVSDDMPNIIAVQLESFFDPTRVRWLRFSEDPVPNWHALCGEYSSGYYTVPTVGAGTVNTEFETLTGMSLRFFGAGEYPYKGILKEETCESAPYVLSRYGYTSHAIHNNEADFYGRRGVYANLGFNFFTSSEYMNTQRDVNESGWMRDRNLIPCVRGALESTENRDFVFVVTVQPHGAYPTEQGLDDPEIRVSGTSSSGEKNAWEYYVSQIREEDQFVADLIAELEDTGEPTLVLFYGDHLPTMGLSDRDIRGRATVFETDYLIWNNFGADMRNGTLTSYQAMAALLDMAGIHDGVMFNYQNTMKRRRDYFYNMQVLQYDLLYGERYAFGMTNPWQKTILAMGEQPVRVDTIARMSPTGVYSIRGQNFTQSCVFQVNGENVETTYLGSDSLLVRDIQLEKGDWVGVAVVSNASSSTVLSTSNTLVYGAGHLTGD